MTEEQVRTYLLLGVKLKRERWTGYIFQEGGTIYKFNADSEVTYNITFKNWFYPKAEEEWGKWEVVNDI
ncbi:hypothetical protein MIF8_38 [Erwinia phage MIF8]